MAIGATATAAAALGTALVKGAGDTAAYGDNIDKMSQKMGLSAEAYQEWDAIMQHSGASIDSMQRGMTTLSQAVENGNVAFESLGISLEDAASMSQEELFEATITALQGMESGTERTVLAQKLLGGSAKELGALLNTSAEDTEAMRKRVHELGGVMSNEAVAAAAHYQDSLQDMQTAFSGLQRGLTSEFMPGITTVMDGLAAVFSGDSTSGIGMISEGIDNVITALSDQLPQFLDLGIGIIESLSTAIIDNLPALADAAIEIILNLVNMIVENLPSLIDAAIEIVFALADGIIDALPQLIPAIISVILTITEKLTAPDTILRLVQAAIQIIGALATGLINAIPQLVQSLPVIVWNIVQTLFQLAPTLISSGWEMIKQLAAGIWNAAGQVWDTIKSVGEGILTAAGEALSSAAEVGKNLVLGIWDGIASLAGWLWDQVSAWVESIWDGILDFFGIASPSKQMKWVGSMLVEGLAGSIEDDGDEAVAAAEAMSNDINNVMNNLADGMGKTMRTDFEVRGSAKTSGAAGSAKSSEDEAPIPIIVQCVLDGQIVSENTTMWQRRMARATG